MIQLERARFYRSRTTMSLFSDRKSRVKEHLSFRFLRNALTQLLRHFAYSRLGAEIGTKQGELSFGSKLRTSTWFQAAHQSRCVLFGSFTRTRASNSIWKMLFPRLPSTAIGLLKSLSHRSRAWTRVLRRESNTLRKTHLAIRSLPLKKIREGLCRVLTFCLKANPLSQSTFRKCWTEWKKSCHSLNTKA